MMRIVAALVFMILPWRLRLFCYRRFFGYQLDKTSRIGFSLVLTRKLIMRGYSKIGHLNVMKSLAEVSMGEHASIGSLNWITGFIENTKNPHYVDQPSRSSKLLVGDHAAITSRHLIDCTDTVSIGRFSTFAGFRSQILTHSISIPEACQRSGPVEIGDYTFVGTSSILLPNACLPSFSVLGAGSVLNKKYTEEYQLYAGNPARPMKKLDQNAAYFKRKTGYLI